MVIAAISLFYAGALQAIFAQGGEIQWHALWADDYLHHIIAFSFGQAALSAGLAVGIGVLVARALYYLDFFGKSWLLKMMSLTFVLPVLVAIFGLMGIYGTSGWLAQIFAFFGFAWQGKIYGLTGIVLAHLFFNIPLAAQLFLQSLHSIPYQQRQLAAQLGIRGGQFVRLVELPALRAQLLPTLSLIFMLCFTSFTVVLTLGGGPQYTTLETAIYQALLFEFDLPKAALFALLQFGFCLLLFSLTSRHSTQSHYGLHSSAMWHDKPQRAVKIFHVFLLLLLSLFLCAPLLNTLVAAISSDKLRYIGQSAQLWRALGYSLAIAPASALLALLMASALLLAARRLHWLHFGGIAQWLMNAGMVILAIPTLVLAMGLFLWLQTFEVAAVHLFFIVVICNALSAMPFMLRILSVPFFNNMRYYERLCQSLGIGGRARFRLIEWHALRAPMRYAFILATALSLGDFTAIALFGNQDFTSLPHLLYQQLGSYRSQEAAVTAGVLLLLCGALFALIDTHKETDDLAKSSHITK